MSLFGTLRFIWNHPLNKGGRVKAIGRFIKWQLKCRLQDEVIFEWIDGSRLAVKKGMTGATGNIYCGLHEFVDMRFVLDNLRQGDVFLDIGANVGSYTVLASKVCGARTIAFEPDPITASALRRNVEVNGIEDKVTIHELALGATKGEARFTIGRDTVNRIAEESDMTARIVKVETLDNVLGEETPRIIKMDVEGYEAEVLKGAHQTLARSALQAIITESFHEEISQTLQAYGFRKVHYNPVSRHLSEQQSFASSNGIYVRKDGAILDSKLSHPKHD